MDLKIEHQTAGIFPILLNNGNPIVVNNTNHRLTYDISRQNKKTKKKIHKSTKPAIFTREFIKMNSF